VDPNCAAQICGSLAFTLPQIHAAQFGPMTGALCDIGLSVLRLEVE